MLIQGGAHEHQQSCQITMHIYNMVQWSQKQKLFPISVFYSFLFQKSIFLDPGQSIYAVFMIFTGDGTQKEN